MPQSADAGSARTRPPVTDRRQLWQAAGTAGLVAVLTTIYYVLPVPRPIYERDWALLFSCGLAALGVLIVLSIARLLRAGEQARVRALILLLCITVLFFSYADVALAGIYGQFVSLHTKTDGLYFSVSTLATVGFGDVHAAGQLARIAVTLQIIFNLVFLGAAIATITGMWRERARRRATGGHAGPGHAG
jgi:voltage-gated potassium channel